MKQTDEFYKSLAEATLHEEAYYQVNKKLLRYLKNPWAVLLLSSFISKYKYLTEIAEEDKRIPKGQPFFLIAPDLAKEFPVSVETVRNTIALLIKEELLIFVEKKGIPPKNYYLINYKKMVELMGRDTNGIE